MRFPGVPAVPRVFATTVGVFPAPAAPRGVTGASARRGRLGGLSAAGAGPRLLALAGLFFLFLGGISGLSDGFQGLGSGLLDRFFRASENPFVGLFVGMLATTVVQSSSVTSSLIVALVAAPESPLPFESAIPMVMGANIGTTVTNTLAALGHLRDREPLRRAFAVATCHDLFNLMAVAILLPVEMATGLLARLSTAALDLFGVFSGAGFAYRSPLSSLLALPADALSRLSQAVAGGAGAASAGLLTVLSAALIVVSLGMIARTLGGLAKGGARESLHRVLGRNAVLTMAVGTLVTMVVQSSSVTTSMLVPLAGAGLLLLDDAFPVTLGANVGTTVTAFLAALAVSGPNAAWGFRIAVVHLLFNLIGIGLIYPVRRIRRMPLAGARRLAEVAVRSRVAVIGYVLALFYGVPALLLVASRALGF